MASESSQLAQYADSSKIRAVVDIGISWVSAFPVGTSRATNAFYWPADEDDIAGVCEMNSLKIVLVRRILGVKHEAGTGDKVFDLPRSTAPSCHE